MPVMATKIFEELALGLYLARQMSGFEDWGTRLTHEVSSAGAKNTSSTKCSRSA